MSQRPTAAGPRRRGGVLMVTGAYFPEISGAGLQCRELSRAIARRRAVAVLTTCTTPGLPAAEELDGVPVRRVFIDVRSRWSKLRALGRMAWCVWRLRRQFDILHLHGFSQKSVPLMLMAWALRKRVMIKLTSLGHDDPLSLRRRQGRLAWWCYRRADLFLAISPGFLPACQAAGLEASRCCFDPNGVDTARFRPAADEDERLRVRERLGLPRGRRLILFVGFFSQDKQPQRLYEAWAGLPAEQRRQTALLFIGATRGRYQEIDADLAPQIRRDAARAGLLDQLLFVEQTHDMPSYYQCADVFVMPSRREGLPMALLEAMACGVPCVASRLRGVTDWVMEHGQSGVLLEPGDAGTLREAIQRVLADAGWSAQLARRARAAVEARFSMDARAQRYLRICDALRDRVPDPSQAGEPLPGREAASIARAGFAERFVQEPVSSHGRHV